MIVLHLLGPAQLIVRGNVVRLSVLLAAVLYYLACQQGWVSRDELLYLFYPEADERSARVNLRQLLRRIQELPFVMLEREGTRLRWDVNTEVAAFEAAALRNDRADLLRLYRGPLLQDFPADPWPEFESWLEVRRGELASRYVHEAVAHAEALRAAGQHDEALATVTEAHRLEPSHEGLLRHYLQALSDTGRSAEVRAVYESFRQRLKTDVGGEPERETQALVATLVTPSRREPTPHNLPPPRTTFVGRAVELESLREHLLDPQVRALTIVGPGGIGKTRLALEAARSLQWAGPFESLTFVGLANLLESEAIPGAIAEALGLGSETNLEALLEYLGQKRLLLLLDNLEQLPVAAEILSPLLDACPRVTLLSTSRESLGLYGERAFVVPALSLPDLRQVSFEAVTGSEAAQVFAQRAQAVNPDFRLTRENAPAVAELCHRLDGLPLALELAAGRARLLSPQALVARLSERLKLLEQGPRSLPPRQQTMQGAIGWSYDLLPDAERRLFRRLAVFSGGCPLTGVGAVCLENEDDALDLCDALVRKNLLKVYSNGEGETRLYMLELLHAYALQRLTDSGEEAAIRTAHARHFLAFARESDVALRGPEQARCLTRLEHDHDNLRAALGWAESHDPTLGLELAGALQGFWDRRSHYAEGRGWLERALENAPQAPAALRAPAHNAAGVLARLQGDHSDAKRHLQAGLELGQPGFNLADFEDAVSQNQLPGFAFNSTVLETGRRLMITPLSFAGVGVQRRAQTLNELWENDGKTIDMNVFTAARASATFPYVSPAAQSSLISSDMGSATSEYHLLDGGYNDNFGIQTSLDFLRPLLEKVCLDDELPAPTGECVNIKRILIIEMRLTDVESVLQQPEALGPVRTELLGPAFGIFNVSNKAQIENNNIDLAAFFSAAEEVGVKVEVLTIQPEESVPGPLSWLLPNEAIERLFTTRFDGTVSNVCRKASDQSFAACSASELVLRDWGVYEPPNQYFNCFDDMNNFLSKGYRFRDACVARTPSRRQNEIQSP